MCPSQEIEIVVSDNASADETQDVVRKIDDPRIKYYRNSNNFGYDANLLKLVERATGEFLFFLNDEDYIELKAIPWILKAIKNARAQNKNITQILGTIGDRRPNHRGQTFRAFGDRILKPGHESLTELAFRYGHMSGVVLKRQAIILDHAKKYVGFCYTHQVLMIQAMIAGSTLCTLNTFCYVGPHQSLQHSRVFTTKGDSNVKGKPYYHYAGRVSQMKEGIKIIHDVINEKRTQDILLNRVRRFAARVLAETFYISFNSFFGALPLVLNIEELRYSPLFWLRIPIELVRLIVTPRYKEAKEALGGSTPRREDEMNTI